MNEGWFAGVDRNDAATAADRIRSGEAAEAGDWPSRAVDAGFATSTEDYYDTLHEATIEAASAQVRERERADDQQLIHAVRALDDSVRTRNELAERVAEWGGSLDADAGTGVEYARDLAETEPTEPIEQELVDLARDVAGLDDRADSLRGFIERSAPTVAPNLSALAGPVLAARLISLAGGLEALAKQPSGTVQVLGAEDALFAHLQGGAPSPKHGIIYTHEYVRGTAPDQRGSAARALAGKLSIAARVDHYAGDLRPDLETELAARIERIRERDNA
jgi:nucleolar protein 56